MVSCEYYESPEDLYVQRGSYGLEYNSGYMVLELGLKTLRVWKTPQASQAYLFLAEFFFFLQRESHCVDQDGV